MNPLKKFMTNRRAKSQIYNLNQEIEILKRELKTYHPNVHLFKPIEEMTLHDWHQAFEAAEELDNTA